jgi:hypothetical protein
MPADWQVLLRYIDDFLFISDDYHAARRFVSTMQKGFPEYGAFVSPAKTLLSFEYATGSQVAPVCAVNQDGTQCGVYRQEWVRELTFERFPLLWFFGRYEDTGYQL